MVHQIHLAADRSERVADRTVMLVALEHGGRVFVIDWLAASHGSQMAAWVALCRKYKANRTKNYNWFVQAATSNLHL